MKLMCGMTGERILLEPSENMSDRYNKADRRCMAEFREHKVVAREIKNKSGHCKRACLCIGEIAFEERAVVSGRLS